MSNTNTVQIVELNNLDISSAKSKKDHEIPTNQSHTKKQGITCLSDLACNGHYSFPQSRTNVQVTMVKTTICINSADPVQTAAEIMKLCGNNSRVEITLCN